MAEIAGKGDHVFSLAVAPGTSGASMWFAACASGLRVSDDSGSTWRDAYRSMALTSQLTAAAVAVSPQFAQDRTLFAGALGGVLRSCDGGDTWTVAILPDPPPYVIALAPSPCYEADGLVFAATVEDGVFRSWDRGLSWASWNFGLLDLNIYSLAISPGFALDDTLYVGTESGIFRSANGGRAWRELPFPMEYAPVLALALSPAFAENGMMLAGTESQGIFRSEDGGVTWSNVLSWMAPRAVNQIEFVRTARDAQTVVALAGASLFHSADGGSTWAEAALPQLVDAAPTCVHERIGPDADNGLLVGFDDGRVLDIHMPE